MSYKHKLFLYYLLKNGVLTLANALQYCRDIKAGWLNLHMQIGLFIFKLNYFFLDEVTDPSSLKEFANVINRDITKQELEIVIGVCEITGQQHIAVINTANDEISKLQNVFTTLQLEFFQKILHEIVTSEEKKLSQIFCLNLSTKLTGKLAHADAERLIDRWSRMDYLVKHESDIYLGSRCIMEFTSFFKSYCKDYVQNCGLCSELVFKVTTILS